MPTGATEAGRPLANFAPCNVSVRCYVSDFGSSWLAIAASQTLSHPLDTIRVRRQTYGVSARESLRRAGKLGGLRGLYGGFGTAAVTTGPVIANATALNDAAKRAWCRHRYAGDCHNGRMSGVDLAVCGAFSGTVAAVFQCPIAVVRVRQQLAALASAAPAATTARPTSALAPAKFMDVTRAVYREAGIAGFFRGLPCEALQSGAGRLIYFTVYERAKARLGARTTVHTHHNAAASPRERDAAVAALVATLPQLVASAVCASWVATAALYPTDVVKTRLQAAYRSAPDATSAPTNFLAGARDACRDGGVRALWRGLGATLARGAVSSGVSLPLYELSKLFVRDAVGVSCGPPL